MYFQNVFNILVNYKKNIYICKCIIDFIRINN